MNANPRHCLVETGPSDAKGPAIPISAVSASALETWLASQPPAVRTWLAATGFRAETGAAALIADETGSLGRVILGLGRGDDPWATGALAKSLPRGVYRIAEAVGAGPHFATWAALAWGLGAYTFAQYKSEPAAERARLQWPQDCDRARVTHTLDGAFLTRDLINTPAADMLPDRLEAAARDVALAHGAGIAITRGEELIVAGYPMIHAVGRASSIEPRLIDITWNGEKGGEAHAPQVTLVGKGVCFDSGGLDLKPSSAMALMKKDMGGAATALGLAQMIMAARLPVRLRVLIPAVENAVAGNAFRPGDVLKTRKGITVEIGNTDAEGRLVLGDALTEALSEAPALLVDFATLTGAARTALGPELPALFCDDEALARDLLAASEATFDPLWRLPLWAPYRKMLDSKVADINNAGDSPFAGAITAALFLKEFAKPKDGASVPWAHIDLYAWNPSERAGRPAGGEALAQRAAFELIRSRFG